MLKNSFKKFILVSAALLSGAVAWATQYSLLLKAVDNDGEPEIYATCRIFAKTDTVHALKAGLTDTLGVYKTSIAAPGDYFLTIEPAGASVGVRRAFSVSEENPDADMGTVIIGGDDQTLNEVTVTAQRPLVTRQIDGIGYDVAADPTSKTVTLQEMMRNVPMVAVDNEGNITINGSSNFKVYKNGRPDNSLSKNAKDIFAALPASMVKKIEVITEPGAKYDAEGIGAILNIITVENSSIKGVTGTAQMSVSAPGWNPGGNLYLMSQIDKVTFSVYGGTHMVLKSPQKQESSSDFTYNNGNTRTGYETGKYKGDFSWFGGEASWDINKKNMLTASLNGYYYNMKPSQNSTEAMFAADGSTLYSYNSSTRYKKNNYLDLNGTVSYQYTTDRSGENLILSYMISTTGQHDKHRSKFTEKTGEAFPYSALDVNSNLDFIEHTFQGDWKRPFGEKHILETGAKYIFRRNHSDSKSVYEDWQDLNTEFRHITDVAALYAQYTARLGKVTLRGGLRYEYSKLKASFPDGSQKSFSSNLSDVVPSASANWQINDVNTLTFNYAARINRPGINYLNPAVFYTPTTMSYGNPDLSSAYSNSLKLSYMFVKPKLNFNLSANYSFNNDNISSVSFVNPEGIIVSTYDNIGRERTLSFSGFVQWSMTPKTQVMLNTGVTRNSYRQEGYSLARWNMHGFFRVTQKLPWNITAEGFLFTNLGKSANSVYSYGHMQDCPIFWNLGLRKSFLKEDRLTLRISANSPIGRNYRDYKMSTVNGDYTGNTIVRTNNIKSVSFSISYRFGKLNAYVKKTAARIDNDDLVGRKSDGGGGSSGGGAASGSGSGTGTGMGN